MGLDNFEYSEILNMLTHKGILEMKDGNVVKGFNPFGRPIVFTKEEYKSMREAIGKQQTVADILSIDYRSLSHRENGKRPTYQDIKGEPALAMLCLFLLTFFTMEEEDRNV